MNICILTDKYPPDVGGLAVSTRRLAQGLYAGHTVCVSVLAASVAPGVVNTLDDEGVTVHRLGSHRRADDTAADWFDHVVALHARHHFDLIHAMYVTQAAFVAVTAARYLGMPSVVSARGNDLDRAAFDPGKLSQISFALQNASAVTVVTLDLARKAVALAPGCQPQFVPNGVDTALFSPGPRDETLAASLSLGDAPVIAFVGEARQKKGLTILLPALAQVCARHDAHPVLLLVGGVRKDDEPILQVFQRQNPALHVRVVSNVPHAQLPAYYRLTDVLAIPSLRDGMPNALLEGMACERAIVASNVGGMPDVVRDGENGLLVPPGDVSALANTLLGLLVDPARRTQLGRAARATVESDFTPERELQRNLEIYRSARFTHHVSRVTRTP
jgi:glycosyltransferase involved in cell wall biosynthesis